MRIWHSWNDRYRPVAVSASSRRVTTDRPAAAACFFSGGVDSFYTLVSVASRYPAGDPRAITHLVLCHGFDIPLADHERFERTRRSAEQVAAESGQHLVPCVTNVREFTRGIDWLLFAFGPCLAGVGLALQSLVGTVYISSGRAYHQLKPEGSHPLVDPLWSTESLDVIHAGAEALRGDKTTAIAHSPLVRRHLRVCWQNTSDFNCCRCEKCIRTMLELELQGVLAETSTFGESLTPEAISAIKVEPFAFHYYEDLAPTSSKLARRSRSPAGRRRVAGTGTLRPGRHGQGGRTDGSRATRRSGSDPTRVEETGRGIVRRACDAGPAFRP